MRDSTRQLVAFGLALLLVIGGATVATQTGFVEDDDAPVGEARALFGADLGISGIATSAATGLHGFAVGLFSAGGNVAEEEEALQQKIDLFQLAATQKENSGIIRTQARNSLQGSDTLLKMEAMNALTRAAKNDTSLSEANARIVNRVDNRTAVKQINVYNAWSAAATNVKYIENVSDISSGISESFSSPTLPGIDGHIDMAGDGSGRILSSVFGDVTIDDSKTDWNKTVTLANGTEHTVTAIPVHIQEDSHLTTEDGSGLNDIDEATLSDQSVTVWIYPGHTPTVDSFTVTQYGSSYSMTSGAPVDDLRFVVNRNQSTTADQYLSQSGDLAFANATEYTDLLTDIDQQNNQATQAVTDLAAAKYSDLRSGAISINQTISPYYADYHYSLEGNESSTWLYNMFATMGTATPQNFQNVSTMTILSGSASYRGILMSDGLPANDTFQVGVEYDPANLTGSQFIVTADGRKVALDEPFTIDSVTRPNGENVTSVTYDKPTYNVTSIEGFRQMTEYLMEERAESEAREQKAEESASLGGLLPNLGGLGGIGLGLGIGGLAVLVIIVVAALLLMPVATRY